MKNIEFKEEDYISFNQDVKEALEKGLIQSAKEHYETLGIYENRRINKLQKTREEKILACIDKNKKGLEIGPSHRPIAPKKDGYNVKIIDHLNKEGLIRKYQLHNIDLTAIEDVDYVWNGEKLSELIYEKFDWIIASHVIEHTPDLIGFLNECENLLVEGGILSLAIPDKRFCFDTKRELTSISKVIDAIGNKIHTKGSVAEYYLKVVKKNGEIAWHINKDDDFFENIHTSIDALKGIEAVEIGEYIDIHNWVFTENSFKVLIQDLKILNLVTLKEIGSFDTVGHEFFISMRKVNEKR